MNERKFRFWVCANEADLRTNSFPFQVRGLTVFQARARGSGLTGWKCTYAVHALFKSQSHIDEQSRCWVKEGIKVDGVLQYLLVLF